MTEGATLGTRDHGLQAARTATPIVAPRRVSDHDRFHHRRRQNARRNDHGRGGHVVSGRDQLHRPGDGGARGRHDDRRLSAACSRILIEQKVVDYVTVVFYVVLTGTADGGTLSAQVCTPG
jgi:hypothetical protein